MAIRLVEVACVALMVLLTTCTALQQIDLATLLKGRHRDQHPLPQKRIIDGNPCSEPEKPFPCKSSDTCIPMGYVCDDNIDCEDGYDEDPDVCTAAHRPPVEDIMMFLDSEKSWIIPNLFGGKSVAKIAHALAVSQKVDDFKRRLGLSGSDVQNLRMALNAVKNGNEEDMTSLGMPPSAWNEVAFVFSKLIKSGFTG